MNFHFLFIVILLSLSACSSSPPSRYADKHDSIPDRLPSGDELLSATPRAEPHSRGGNKHYTVRGKHYKVMKSAEGFKEIGVASWYGNKFHGHLTSNGEVYDMYAMSAAHKHLPLPTYVNVKNLKNNKSIIVRVNDRGPFHNNRIIDLSYSAAYQLDMLGAGTAKVEVTAITDFSATPTINMVTPVNAPAQNSMPAISSDKNYIQVFATRNVTTAQLTAQKLQKQYQHNVIWPEKEGIFRVKMGPINDPNELNRVLTLLRNSDYPKAYARKLIP